jgi:hypothetical protein
MNKNKKALPRTYKGRATKRHRQTLYWRWLVSLFLVAVVFLGFMGEHYTNAYQSQATVTVTRPKRTDLSVLSVLDNTPMAEAKDLIAQASVYYNVPLELYLGIASAESSFKRFRCFNPWGIDTGRGNDPRCYNNWEHSINGFSQLIRYYYLDEGLRTPETLVRKYVGWYNPDWVRNVGAYYR